MTWHEKSLVRWGFNDIPATREMEILAAEFCNMFSPFFTPLKLEMYRKTGDVKITLESIGIIPAIVKEYGYADQPMTVLCKSKVRKTSGFLLEELEVPGDGADSSIFVGIDEDGYHYITLELNSDEWFKDDTDSEWLRMFNNCLAEAARVLEVGEVVCDCSEPKIDDLVDDDGFSSRMIRKPALKRESTGQ
ncbi:MAG: hypothetical protein ACE5QW_00335 [Thermoplasmata archaeon]